GHSFGCKVCLACLACGERAAQQVDSLTLLQGAVSSLCFAPSVKDVENTPAGLYADVPKRVNGPISITFTKNDAALTTAYVSAALAAGQVAELPTSTYQPRKLKLYRALGGEGIAGLKDVVPVEMGSKGTAYKFRPGLNTFNADKLIRSHADF